MYMNKLGIFPAVAGDTWHCTYPFLTLINAQNEIRAAQIELEKRNKSES